MEKEKIKLTSSELRDIVYDDNENYGIIKETITGDWRHGTEEEVIVKRVSDGKFFKLNYRNSVKDECEFADMNYDAEYEQVFARTTEIIIYE